ncbi:cytoplasmic dynein 1 light intermediate chain 2-like [Daktulosphaira vitifoliae]|uniref:cytoplasmic dynein 1 light intermediate chain 2-like n=1 Tax=Daktulosphaira vitifoliae TaxID=58002 RepID=UPI0021A9D252|nr:cytoplasmic dynein 1 light intermediate chain 2-like [Daktulosphaira vitifoliae]
MDASTCTLNNDSNHWNSLLLDVQNKSRKKLPENKNVLLLGDSKSGKTTLVTKLQGLKDSKQGWGMEYGYIQIRDDSTDENAQLNVWTLDGDRSLKYLMKFALNEYNFEDTTIILVASMKQPWKIMESLEYWSARLQDHIDKLNLGMELTQNLRDRCVDRIIDYCSPDDPTHEVCPKVRLLNEGVLTRNLGLDVVVVITMTDCIKNLEIDNYSDEHFDYIQCALRKFSLQFGASLFYVSAMEDKNCDLLYKYLMHRIYRFPFKTPALIVEKDSVFVPSGWDSLKKISVVYENMHKINPESHYSDAIPHPYEKNHKEYELQDEDEQAFLAKQLVLLNQTVVQPQTPVARKSPEIQKPLSTKRDAENPPASSERALASFFNALLQKKQESPSSRTPSKISIDNTSSLQLDSNCDETRQN